MTKSEDKNKFQIEVITSDITSMKETYCVADWKLRIRILDNDKIEYDLRVTCKYLRDMLDNMKNLDDFNAEMQASGSKAHVRVGLAKPYAYKDNNCYLIGNGVFFY